MFLYWEFGYSLRYCSKALFELLTIAFVHAMFASCNSLSRFFIINICSIGASVSEYVSIYFSKTDMSLLDKANSYSLFSLFISFWLLYIYTAVAAIAINKTIPAKTAIRMFLLFLLPPVSILFSIADFSDVFGWWHSGQLSWLERYLHPHWGHTVMFPDISTPQNGQHGALSLTSWPHSGHFITDISYEFNV